MQRFTELKVWQRSHALTLAIYRLTQRFPADERFGLVSQLRRAATSVPTNIAEGSRRNRPLDYARFLNVAEASLGEVEYLLMLVRDLAVASADEVQPLLDEAAEIFGMLYTLRQRVETDG
jgi:four helix bundle protein